MIGRLRGTIVHDEPDGTVIIDVQGVGYEVLAPLGTLGRLRTEGNADVTLFVHTHVREDVLQLFGFATLADRTAFRILLGVSSIGPRIALAILSALPGAELAGVLARQELSRLTAISGVGKKTAERLLLELRDKFPWSPTEAAAPPSRVASGATPTTTEPTKRELLLSALTRLGYKLAEAERAVDTLDDTTLRDQPLTDLVRDALKALAK